MPALNMGIEVVLAAVWKVSWEIVARSRDENGGVDGSSEAG